MNIKKLLDKHGLKVLQKIEYSDGLRHCGGFKHCIDRECDKEKKDCQECIKNFDDAMKEIDNV